MGQAPELDMDEVMPEFGVTRREVDAEIKRRLAAPGRSYTAEEVREHFRRRSVEAQPGPPKKSHATDR
jgi:hypothetical protein